MTECEIYNTVDNNMVIFIGGMHVVRIEPMKMDRMVVGFTTVPINTKVVSSNHAHGEVYSINM
jgi:hypothetical protein